MTHKERLAWLIEKHGTEISGNYLCDVHSDILFAFDDGRKWNLKHIDMDTDGDIYVRFHECDEKFWFDEFSENEQSMLIFCLQ